MATGALFAAPTPADAGTHRARSAEAAVPALDTLTLLRRDLPRGPLLTAEQEQALARRMRGADVRVPAPGDPRPSPRAAHDRLVEENLRLVLAIARRYRGRGLPLEDLVQEGALALRRAAEGFDPDQGSRFASYAVLWVREAMVGALTRDVRAIRLPPRVAARVGQLARAEERLRARLEREPRPTELAAELGMSADEVEELRRVARRAVALDAPASDEEPAAGLVLADPAPPPEAATEQRDLREEVHRVLAALEPREQRVLALRFGIGQERPRSPAEVGEALGVSRRQVERLELQAMSRLRAARGARDLLVYLR